MRRPGKIVQTEAGHLGRTYNHEEPIRGKIRVHLFPVDESDKLRKIFDMPPIDPPANLDILCVPSSLKILGFAD